MVSEVSLTNINHTIGYYNFLPLPPYSPEYNPIEKTWAHIKKHLKKVLPSCNTFYEALLSCSCFN
ncbi:transposase [Streptococcus pneumoniae]|nr:transposase [Streptococcus pneumoniae]KYA23386.1 transposase [Streptococcus pneumoniae]KYB03873.1 transposase [Streptococcus pneumoniae]